MVTLAKIRRKGGIVAVSESLVILSLELLNIPSTNTPPPPPPRWWWDTLVRSTLLVILVIAYLVSGFCK